MDSHSVTPVSHPVAGPGDVAAKPSYQPTSLAVIVLCYLQTVERSQRANGGGDGSAIREIGYITGGKETKGGGLGGGMGQRGMHTMEGRRRASPKKARGGEGYGGKRKGKELEGGGGSMGEHNKWWSFQKKCVGDETHWSLDGEEEGPTGEAVRRLREMERRRGK